MTGWRIALAPLDADRIMPVMAAAFPPEYGEGWSHGQTQGMLASPFVRLWCAQSGGGDIIGFALARQIADEAELLMLAVTPGWRRAGIGGALLTAVTDSARAAGAARLFLEMREGNEAVALYRARGFVPIGRRCGYYRTEGGGAIDAMTYALRL